MASREQDATGSLALADDMAGGRRGEDAVLAYQELFDAVCSADVCNQLNDLGVPIPAVASDDEECIWPSGESPLAGWAQGGRGEDIPGELTLGALGNGQQDARDEALAVVWLLEDGDLLPEPGSVMRQQMYLLKSFRVRTMDGIGPSTNVPGFWSVKGLSSTVWTFIFGRRLVFGWASRLTQGSGVLKTIRRRRYIST